MSEWQLARTENTDNMEDGRQEDLIALSDWKGRYTIMKSCIFRSNNICYEMESAEKLERIDMCPD